MSICGSIRIRTCFFSNTVILYGYGFSPPKIKLAASNFARRFIGVQGRESATLGNYALPEAQNRTNRLAGSCCNVMLLGFCDSHAYQVRAAYERRIGLCGYTAIPEDGRTYYYYRITSVRGQDSLWNSQSE